MGTPTTQPATPAPTTYRAYRCRLYPKPAQVAYFRRLFAACRDVYNHFLQVRIDAYDARQSDPGVRIPTRFDMCKMLTTYKKTARDADGRLWLADVDSTALVYEIQHLDDAFRRFFQRANSGDSRPGFPRPKRADGDRDSATVAFKRLDFVERNRIRFAKIGWVNAKCWRAIEGVPMSCTVSVDAAGRWWASIQCRDVPASGAPEPMEEECVVRFGARVPGARDERQERQERKRRREERKLARRKGNNRKRVGTSKRYLEQDRKVAAMRAHEADGLRTRAQQEAAAIARGARRIVVEGEAATAQERALLAALESKCAEWGREFVRQDGS